MSVILLGLGSSQYGRWGTPSQCVSKCAAVLTQNGFTVNAMSGLYETAGVGPGRDCTYVNAVLAGHCHLAPHALWRMLKSIERQAGPRSAMPWGPRALDIDILDYKGRIMGWERGSRPVRKGSGDVRPTQHAITVPHPAIQDRPFVLVPLLQVAPDWRHPALQIAARDLWRRISGHREGRILQAIAGAD